MRALPYTALAAVLCLATQVRAQEPEQGTGLICDTTEQVEQVMTAYDNSRDWNRR